MGGAGVLVGNEQASGGGREPASRRGLAAMSTTARRRRYRYLLALSRDYRSIRVGMGEHAKAAFERGALPRHCGYRPRWCSMSHRAICWARLEASASPSVAEMMEPFIRMCQDRANSSGRSSPASWARAWMWPRMRLR